MIPTNSTMQNVIRPIYISQLSDIFFGRITRCQPIIRSPIDVDFKRLDSEKMLKELRFLHSALSSDGVLLLY